MRVSHDKPLLKCDVCLQMVCEVEVLYVSELADQLQLCQRQLCDGCLERRAKARQRIAVIRDGEDPERQP